MGDNLTSTDKSEGYVTHSKSKINSVIHGIGEDNVMLLQTITSEDNEEALAGAATALSLLSPPTDNLAHENLSQSSVEMKCYYQ